MKDLPRRFLPAATLALALAVPCAAAPAQSSPPAAGESRPATAADFRPLAGRWTRTDGGYVLQLDGVGEKGAVRASYFNPRPVRVGRAEARAREGSVGVVVELRDANYPGSTYRLVHEPSTDRLRGTYYQAVEGATYEVEFVRAGR